MAGWWWQEGYPSYWVAISPPSALLAPQCFTKRQNIHTDDDWCLEAGGVPGAPTGATGGFTQVNHADYDSSMGN